MDLFSCVSMFLVGFVLRIGMLSSTDINWTARIQQLSFGYLFDLIWLIAKIYLHLPRYMDLITS